jgi:hypothetical protein
MMKKPIALLLLTLLLLSCLFGCQSAPKLTLLSAHEGETVPLVDEVIAGYLACSFEEGLDYLHKNSYRTTKVAHDVQTVMLQWEGGEAPYTVTVSENEDLSDALLFPSNKAAVVPGVLMQMNARTVITKHGFFEERRIKRVLDNGLIDLIASDAHNVSGRSCKLGDAHTRLSELYGASVADRMCGGKQRELFHL